MSVTRPVTIDHTKVGTVGNTDQSNFPVLFSGTYAYLATVANGGLVQNSSGYDITFSSDSAGATLLNWEIEYYDPTTGTIVAWILVPTVSHSADTVLYLHYENASITTFQGGAAGSVWDSNFAAVWHLGDGTTLNPDDSTANGNNGVNNGATAAAGEIDGAASLSAGTTHIVVTDSTALDFGLNSFSVSSWLNPAAYPPSDPGIMVGKMAASTITGWYCGLNLSGNIDFRVRDVGGANYTDLISTATLSLSTWVNVACIVDRTANSLRLYFNGVEDVAAQTSISGFGSFNTTEDLFIGDLRGDTLFAYSGLVDEVRISNSIRSADWIISEYNNQNDPASFYSVGAPLGGGPHLLTMLGCGT